MKRYLVKTVGASRKNPGYHSGIKQYGGGIIFPSPLFSYLPLLSIHKNLKQNIGLGLTVPDGRYI